MSESCLHCAIRDAIEEHAEQARPRLADGTAVVVAPEALAALAACAADIIAAHPEQATQVAAFNCLMSALAGSLSVRGVPTTVSTAGQDPDGIGATLQ